MEFASLGLIESFSQLEWVPDYAVSWRWPPGNMGLSLDQKWERLGSARQLIESCRFEFQLAEYCLSFMY